jgi:hypothetical protein
MKIHFKKGNQTFGPHSMGEVKQLLAQGDISLSDSAFIEGTSEWISVNDVLPPSQVPVKKARTVSSPQQKTTVPNEYEVVPNGVTVVGFDMPFIQLTDFLIKFWFASLLASLAIGLLLAIIGGVIAFFLYLVGIIG